MAKSEDNHIEIPHDAGTDNVGNTLALNETTPR